MPRSNVSHASYSSAASASFRIKSLKRAGILFTPSGAPCPEEIAVVRDVLISCPRQLRACNNIAEVETLVPQLEQPHADDFRRAVKSAKSLPNSKIDECALQHERVWMRVVNEVILHELIDAKSARELTSTEDYLWTEGRHLIVSSAESLHDPKPDFAFGIAPKNASQAEDKDDNTVTFDDTMLDALHRSVSSALTYSPSQMQDICYPCIVYEAKSDKNPILWAENQVAVGAARALALLSELAELSAMSFTPCIVALTSAGSQWNMHLAYVGQDSEVILTPVLDRPLWIRDEIDRTKLFALLSRVKRWILGPFREAVSERVVKIWREERRSERAKVEVLRT
ncbi:hypothetical protein FA10DRAFT_270064 [Acaromyces ingoldii]|uniref:Uncharacterized protein n=1 Tax=Acaromyces ingoldii TaxID=215250 RepID=A0A316YAM7_9BASI|nr:hypothetical protein FA10DRAFT_270064 [Acaromyces ingoldii]PWN86696.1 hypothetical protein FA10DRAFT_270064 [Acaromyces ingoldii]